MKRFSLAPVWFAVAGCGADNAAVVCTPVDIPAITLTILDDQTGALILSRTSVVWTQHGFPPDTATGSNEPFFIGSSPGTYDLSVTSSGYLNWAKNNIVAKPTDGGCHPITVKLDARLQKLL